MNACIKYSYYYTHTVLFAHILAMNIAQRALPAEIFWQSDHF